MNYSRSSTGTHHVQGQPGLYKILSLNQNKNFKKKVHIGLRHTGTIDNPQWQYLT